MKAWVAAIIMGATAGGCSNSSPNAPENNANVALTAEAGVFMGILKENGVLPEIPADRHGNLQSDMMCDPKDPPEFPFQARFRAIMNDAPDTVYDFVAIKDSPTAPWTVSESWKECAGQKTAVALPSADSQRVANEELLRRKNGR